MKLKKILESGYFPKELPPPFETKIFALKARYIKVKWEKLLLNQQLPKSGESNKDAKKRFTENYTLKYGSSKILDFSLAKGPYSRRKLGIPNPKQFLDLSIAVNDNWILLKEICELSKYSQSYPVEHESIRSVRTKSKSWNEFKFKLIENSFNKKIQLQLDITQFYPSIYTHSIPWAILGKEESKRYFKIKNTQPNVWAALATTDAGAQKYRIADFLDTLIRNCNDRQSIGLPIGPDTSFILAECIGSRLDYEINKRIESIDHTATRYFDDYYFYLNSIDEAENVLKKVQQVLNDFQLETNESKINITNQPFSFNENWATEISSFRFQNIDKYELRHYFSVVFKVLKENRKNTSWVVHYALGRFEYGHVLISKGVWDVFLLFLLKTLSIDPSNINQIFKIILSYKSYLNAKSKDRIAKILETIILDHLPLNHTFEVSWSVWIFRSLQIKCPNYLLESIISSNDSISKIIVLDIINSSLYMGRKPALTALALSLSGDDLFDQNWLITYESYKKNWLNFRGRNIFNKNEFMKIISDYNVEFYNQNNQIETEFDIETPPTSSSGIRRRNNGEFYNFLDSWLDGIDNINIDNDDLTF